MRNARKLSLVLSALALSVIATVLGAGCGGGYSEQDATDRCNIEKVNQAACFNGDSYDACIACFEECGDKCAVAESCPVQYACQQ